jgi:hypothetical protein
MTRSRARQIVLSLAVVAGLSATVTPALAAAHPAPASLAGAAPGAPAKAASKAPADTAGQAAAGWLARQMIHGTHLVEVYDGKSYADQGETIDAIFAFAATRSAGGYGARAITWLERPGILSGYIGNGTTQSYAGATAKTALAAEVRGINPAKFGGVNLIARLLKLLKPSGRFSDHSPYGDYSNAFSQALAIIALRRHGTVPVKAVRFLRSSECKNGGFPLYFAQKSCVSDPDATAMDVQALLAVGWKGSADRGLNWLASDQKPSGGFVASGGALANANSTGLAGEAFADAKWSRHAAAAQRFLIRLQVGCWGKASHRGAITYDASGYQPSTVVDATAQGILGVADVGLATLSSRGSRHDDPALRCSS